MSENTFLSQEKKPSFQVRWKNKESKEILEWKSDENLMEIYLQAGRASQLEAQLILYQVEFPLWDFFTFRSEVEIWLEETGPLGQESTLLFRGFPVGSRVVPYLQGERTLSRTDKRQHLRFALQSIPSFPEEQDKFSKTEILEQVTIRAAVNRIAQKASMKNVFLHLPNIGEEKIERWHLETFHQSHQLLRQKGISFLMRREGVLFYEVSAGIPEHLSPYAFELASSGGLGGLTGAGSGSGSGEEKASAWDFKSWRVDESQMLTRLQRKEPLCTPQEWRENSGVSVLDMTSSLYAKEIASIREKNLKAESPIYTMEITPTPKMQVGDKIELVGSSASWDLGGFEANSTGKSIGQLRILEIEFSTKNLPSERSYFPERMQLSLERINSN